MSRSDDPTEAILDAAVRLHRRAPGTLDMGAVAREAGLSRATLYRHIDGRESLLALLVSSGRLPAVAADRDRARLLGVAFQVLLDRGPSGFTMGAIAKAADVDPSTLHRRFGTRQGLLDAVIEEFGGRRHAWQLGTDPARDPADELREFTLRLLQLMPRLGALMRFAVGVPKADRRRFQKLRRAGEGTEIALARWFETLQKRRFLAAGDAHLLAQSYLGLVFSLGWLFPDLAETPTPPHGTLAEFVVTRFLDGARAPAATWADR